MGGDIEIYWESGDIKESDLASYSIPFKAWLRSLLSGQTLVMAGLIVVAILLVVFIAMQIRSREIARPEMFDNEDNGFLSQVAESTSHINETEMENRTEEKQTPVRDRGGYLLGRHIFREEMPGLYMKDFSYRMLQNAIRGSKRYSEASIVFATGPENKRYDLFLETTILGNGRWANIHLNDPSASPVHAKIRKVDGHFVIYDMASVSGVYVNGKKLLRPRSLENGDELRMGQTRFLFEALD